MLLKLTFSRMVVYIQSYNRPMNSDIKLNENMYVGHELQHFIKSLQRCVPLKVFFYPPSSRHFIVAKAESKSHVKVAGLVPKRSFAIRSLAGSRDLSGSVMMGC